MFVCLKLPRCIRGAPVDLHRLTIRDGPFLKKVLAHVRTLGRDPSRGFGKTSWLDLWWWARKEYICVYTIRNRERRIGLVGLHGFAPGGSSEMTLIIPSEADRRKGYGAATFRLFLRYLSRTDAVNHLVIRIDQSDRGTLHFWEGMGFRQGGQDQDLAILTREISPLISSPPEGGPSSPSAQPHR